MFCTLVLWALRDLGRLWHLQEVGCSWQKLVTWGHWHKLFYAFPAMVDKTLPNLEQGQ